MKPLFGITDSAAFRVQAALLRKSLASPLISGLGEAPSLRQGDTLVRPGLSSGVEIIATGEEIASKLSNLEGSEVRHALHKGISTQTLISSFEGPGLGLSGETQALFAQSPFAERAAATAVDILI
ncbi:MAG: hypothetical protein ACE5LX_01715 [Nitrospinota bacterium]